jgi:hypothetical protein
VRVHIPQARNDGLAGNIQDLRIFGQSYFAAWASRQNFAVLDDHRRVLQRRGARAVDECSSNQSERPLRLVAAEVLREFRKSGHLVGSRSLHKTTQVFLVLGPDCFEMVVFAVNRDERGEPALGVKPECLATPRQVRDAKTLQINLRAIYRKLVRPTILDSQFPRRECLKFLCATGGLPSAKEHHLKSSRSIGCYGEELCGSLRYTPFGVNAGQNFVLFYQNRVIDRSAACHIAMDFHRPWCKIQSHPNERAKRNILAAVIEMKRNRKLQFIALPQNGVFFFADGLLELVKTECAFFE